jgi:hypothetical protein
MKTEDTISIAPATTSGTATRKKVRASKSANPAAKQASKTTAPKNRVAKSVSVSKKAARAKPNKCDGRADTKRAIILELLRRKQGATTTEIARATDWRNHSIRGSISGQVTKKMGIAVEPSKSEAGQRTYRIAK